MQDSKNKLGRFQNVTLLQIHHFFIRRARVIYFTHYEIFNSPARKVLRPTMYYFTIMLHEIRKFGKISPSVGLLVTEELNLRIVNLKSMFLFALSKVCETCQSYEDRLRFCLLKAYFRICYFHPPSQQLEKE